MPQLSYKIEGQPVNL